MRFIQNLNLGFSKDQLMIIPLNNNNIRSKIASFKQELSKNPYILLVGPIPDLPGDTASPYSGSQYLLKESAVKKLGWKILEVRGFHVIMRKKVL
jgi:hypothetical protein